MRMTQLLLPSLLALSLVACSKGDETRSSAANAEPRHADTTAVVPGSYEDWCGEHAVPESKCTRCNPSLIPAFKATNDWCAEHDRPESQCLICNPTLKIERPPKPSAG